jgi:hypothetical protein
MRRIWYGYTKKKASLTVALNWPKGKGIAPQAGGLFFRYPTNRKAAIMPEAFGGSN